MMEKIKRAQHALVFMLTLVILACSKNESIPDRSEPPQVDTGAVTESAGNFINGPYGSVSGTAALLIQDGQYLLSLSNFSTSNGPDLHVYLSKEQQPIRFIDLGRLRQNRGDQVYRINGITDANQYRFALIHCQQFNHLFGSASLQ